MKTNMNLVLALAIFAGIFFVTFVGQPQPTAKTEYPRPTFTFEDDETKRDPVTVGKLFGQYRVETGDTFYGIADSFGLTIDELLFANPQLETNPLMTGEVLNIPSID